MHCYFTLIDAKKQLFSSAFSFFLYKKKGGNKPALFYFPTHFVLIRIAVTLYGSTVCPITDFVNPPAV